MFFFSLQKTRGIGEYASYQSSPSPQNFVPSSPSPVSPGGTLRQPSQFQPQKSVKGWAPVTHPATSPLPQTPLQAPTWGQPQQQTAVLQTQVSLHFFLSSVSPFSWFFFQKIK